MSESQNTNSFGLTKQDYVGARSTLCTGCGHDSITQGLINGIFASGTHPFDIIKLSGIGCSSKTTNYFLNQSHGFNSIHGRMAPLATGAKLANRKLRVVGVSGDGDSASIGLGGLLHLFRRNVPMVYILENNAVYGLTKGQFSATADTGTKNKSGTLNPFTNFDLCALAIESGCPFVARSFSGDAKQLVPLVQAALHFEGTAFIDVVSPCITYANHEGSTASYDYVREHKVNLQELGFIPNAAEVAVDYNPGEHTEVKLATGAILTLKKLEADYDFTDSAKALDRLHRARGKNEILTGLIYKTATKETLPTALELTETPLVKLSEKQLRPDATALADLLKMYQ
jgi:2-oxoglutarate/2-oxoacid ferredoxin oxidoreductase subunit beta